MNAGYQFPQREEFFQKRKTEMMEKRMIKIFVLVMVFSCGFASAMVRDFETKARGAHFYTTVERVGDGVKFSLFTQGILSVQRILSGAQFNAFTEYQHDSVHLVKQGDAIQCHIFDQARDISYDFSFFRSGDIDLSVAQERTTGALGGVTYAFKTSGVVKNQNPAAFHGLFIDSQEIHNSSLLKIIGDYYIRYHYFYNSGIWDTRLGHSAIADIGTYAEARLLPQTAPAPVFKQNEWDNYGVELGGSAINFGGPVKVNSYGIVSYDSICFETPGSSLNVQGLFHVSDKLSGNLASIDIQDRDASVEIGQFDINPLASFTNRGNLFIKTTSTLDVGTISNFGEICGLQSLTLRYTGLTGDGRILVRGRFNNTRRGSGAGFVENEINAHEITSDQMLGVIRGANADQIAGIIAQSYTIMDPLKNSLTRLDLLEQLSSGNARDLQAINGSINRTVIRLKQSDASTDEIARLLSNPRCYACFDIDATINGRLIQFYTNPGTGDDGEESPEITRMVALDVSLWDHNFKKLQASNPTLVELMLQLWRRRITSAFHEFNGEREEARRAIQTGRRDFFLYASSLGMFSGLEAIAEMISRRGAARIAALLINEAGNRACFENVLNGVRNFVFGNGIRHFVNR